MLCVFCTFCSTSLFVQPVQAILPPWFSRLGSSVACSHRTCPSILLSMDSSWLASSWQLLGIILLRTFWNLANVQAHDWNCWVKDVLSKAAEKRIYLPATSVRSGGRQGLPTLTSTCHAALATLCKFSHAGG